MTSMLKAALITVITDGTTTFTYLYHYCHYQLFLLLLTQLVIFFRISFFYSAILFAFLATVCLKQMNCKIISL